MLTYLRTAELPDAVDAVLEATRSGPCPATVLVVDNDPAGGAMPLQHRWSTDHVRFVHEPTPGIAAARNRALDEADTAGDELLVFIDDDERPSPGWLEALVRTWEDTGAAAVVGPVVSSFDDEPEPWIVAGGFFERRRLPTGTEVDTAATNNLLLDLAQVRRFDVRFEPRLGTVGGSDTLFTRQLHQRGGRIVWCDEAVVHDVVPSSRLTRAWVVRRAMRLGNSDAHVSVLLAPTWRARCGQRLRCTSRGLVRIAGGAARIALGTLRGSLRHRARGRRTLARGVGMVGGAWGWVYAEYRRTPRP